MAKRLIRERLLSDEERAKLRAAREEFVDHPSKRRLLESGTYIGPMAIEEYLAWRQGAGAAPLTEQLQAALSACGQSIYAISKSSGVSAPVIQRFMTGERGITLDTAGRLAAYLGLALLPDSQRTE